MTKVAVGYTYVSANFTKLVVDVEMISRHRHIASKPPLQYDLQHNIPGGPKNGATLHFPKYLENY